MLGGDVIEFVLNRRARAAVTGQSIEPVNR
jgi:hypothetical protein